MTEDRSYRCKCDR